MEAQETQQTVPAGEMPVRKPVVYQTKIPHSELKPETLLYLTGWKKPQFAYVLFEKREIHLGKDMNYRIGTGLMTLNLEARPEQESKLNYYVFKKRFRIIDYGNFPKANDSNPARAMKAKMYSGANGANPWDAMEQTILGIMGSNPNWREEKAKYENELRGMEAKLKAEEARIKALEAQLTGGENGKATQGKPGKGASV